MAYFPMYIDLEGKKVIVVGGGKAALRKINSLLYFGAKIAVIAPKVCDDIKAIKGINVHESNVALDILQNADIVVAATRRPEINAKIGTYCNDRGIMVNVADNKELSSFLFPGVIVRGDLVVGVTTGGNSQAVSKQIRNMRRSQERWERTQSLQMSTSRARHLGRKHWMNSSRLHCPTNAFLTTRRRTRCLTNITVRTQPEETHKYLLIFVLELFDNYDTISEIVIDYSMRVGLGPLSIVVGIIFYRKVVVFTKRADIEAKTEALVMPIIEANNLELVDVEYVKEGSDYYLRVYADKEGGITIGDCEIVNRALGDLLDQDDYIGDAYILEVSSPGLTRPLKKEKDFKRSIGKVVEIKTFARVNGAKEFEGVLKAYDENTVTIELEDETEITITRKDISMIRLAFIY